MCWHCRRENAWGCEAHVVQACPEHLVRSADWDAECFVDYPLDLYLLRFNPFCLHRDGREHILDHGQNVRDKDAEDEDE